MILRDKSYIKNQIFGGEIQHYKLDFQSIFNALILDMESIIAETGPATPFPADVRRY